MSQRLIFGYPDQQQEFQNRNREFMERFPNLREALDTAFSRKATVTSAVDKAILFLGRLCIEDFMEILCLAANGYGLGAMKLVRGLYERAVTASYLSNHPGEAPAFLDWRFVSRYKTVQAYVQGGTPSEAWVLKADEMRSAYDRIKGQYEVDDCKKCGTKRINHSWSRLDFVAMAKKTGDLGMLLGQAYYVPLNHAHSTAEALMTRLKVSEDGEIGFDPGPQPRDADVALQLSHAIMISLLEVQQIHFGLSELALKFERCANDHVEIWSGRMLAQDPSEL